MSNPKLIPFVTGNRDMGALDSGGEPPDNDGMELRVGKLENSLADVKERLVRMEARLDSTATKADLADQLKWIVGTAIALGAVAITVMTFVLNNAAPKAQAAQAAPIIITIPAQSLQSRQ